MAGCDDWQVLSLKPDGVGCGPCGLWVAERWTIDYQSLLCLQSQLARGEHGLQVDWNMAMAISMVEELTMTIAMTN